MEPRPYVKDELLKVLAVEPPSVVVEGMNGARHRARCIPSHESLRAEPLRPGDILTVHTMTTDLAIVERVTQGHRDGCRYELLEFQLISPPA
jgi:hypothetical protein